MFAAFRSCVLEKEKRPNDKPAIFADIIPNQEYSVV